MSEIINGVVLPIASQGDKVCHDGCEKLTQGAHPYVVMIWRTTITCRQARLILHACAIRSHVCHHVSLGIQKTAALCVLAFQVKSIKYGVLAAQLRSTVMKRSMSVTRNAPEAIDC